MPKRKKNFSLGKIIFWLFLLIFAWILITHFGQTKQIIFVLTTGKWYWVGLAILFQLFYYPFYSFFCESIFSIFRVDFKRRHILPVYLASKFTDVALPIATFGQLAVFVRHGKKHDLSPINVGIGISFVLFSEVLAFLGISLIVLLTLYFFGDNRVYLWLPLLILAVVLVSVIVFLLRLAVYHIPPNRFVLWIIRHLAKIGGQKTVTHDDLEKIFLEIGADLQTNKKKIIPGLLFALTTHLINLATLFFVCLAFVGHVNILAVLAGYVACLLFTIVSITPQGVGVAEAVMIATLRSFGMDLSEAAVVTLAFRGLLYWLPLFAGFYAFEKLEWDRHHAQ